VLSAASASQVYTVVPAKGEVIATVVAMVAAVYQPLRLPPSIGWSARSSISKSIG
jgi:hypothetical protein